MNKVLKIVLIVLGILLGAFLILGLIMPKDYIVSRHIAINSPRDSVYNLVNSLQKIDKWNPWKELDPKAKITFTGTEGAIGSKTSWVGNDDMGEGEQEIKELKSGEMMHTELRFKKPWESTSQAFINLKDGANGGTDVKWEFQGCIPFPWNGLGLFFDMDKAIGKDFQKGLNKLKTLAE
jgi:hypothetical protein